MIYTLTINPAIDYMIHMPNLNKGAINRSSYEEIFVGGKGINVSIVLKNLGKASTAQGFIAGFTGERIEQGVKDMGINTDFIRLKSGTSRINVKIRTDEETDINCQGPDISDDDFEFLFRKVRGLTSNDTLVLAGSVPSCISDRIYSDILKNANCKAVVDACGSLLLNTLQHEPLLIKPNLEELASTVNRTLDTISDIIDAAKLLRAKGAANVLVSMGGNGAILIDNSNNVHIKAAPNGKVVNTVGAGDSMTAGFIAALEDNCDTDYCLKLGVACGSAAAFSSGLPTKEDINSVLALMD